MRWCLRRLHQSYAWLLGYFWLPCPICGEMFGGHEAGDGAVDGRVVCYRAGCVARAVAGEMLRGLPPPQSPSLVGARLRAEVLNEVQMRWEYCAHQDDEFTTWLNDERDKAMAVAGR